MTKQEQNKNWSLLSEESKYHYQTEYKNRLEDSEREIEDPEGGGDLTVLTSQNIAKDLENLFGKHNLQSKLTYEDVVKELFKNGAWQPYDYKNGFCSEEDAEPTYCLNCTSAKQAQKLLAINKLLNVAKFLNKNEDGTDWAPDWENEKQEKYSYDINCRGKINIINVYVNNTFVHFATPMLAKQAIEILGEEVIRTVLGNY